MHVLCAGAAQRVLESVAAEFTDTTGMPVTARFAPVGVLRDAVLAGDTCDVLIASEAIVSELAQMSHLRAASCAGLGGVATGIAVRSGDPAPDTSTGGALAAALSAVEAIYLPDPRRATAGIHLTTVLRRLGIYDACRSRLRALPGGAHAMTELADADDRTAIGFAQVTEILATPGVEPAGTLPAEHALVTVYSAAVTTSSSAAEAATDLVVRLCSPEGAGVRRAAGFEDIA